MSINGTDPKLLNNSVCFFSYTKNKLMPHKPKHFVLNTWRHSSYNCWSCSLIKARVPSYSCGSLASHTRSVLMPCPLAGTDSVQIQQNTLVTTSKPIYTLHPSIHTPPLSVCHLSCLQCVPAFFGSCSQETHCTPSHIFKQKCALFIA